MQKRYGVIALVSLLLLANLSVAVCAAPAPCGMGCASGECCASMAPSPDVNDAEVLSGASCVMNVDPPVQLPAIQVGSYKQAVEQVAVILRSAVAIPVADDVGVAIPAAPDLASDPLYIRNHILII